MIDDKILPFVPQNIRDSFSYILGIRKNGENFVKDEFENRVFLTEPKFIEGSLQSVNEDKFNAIDGKALKYCDKIAAYFEAGISMSYGVKSKELVSGFESMDEFFKAKPKVEGVNFYEICEEFKKHFGLEA